MLMGLIWGQWIATVEAREILTHFPAYPGSERPLPGWEDSRLAIARTLDKPEAVITYYRNRLTQQGWRVDRFEWQESLQAARSHQPAWLVFERPGEGRLDLQVVPYRDEKTRQYSCWIYYQSRRLL